MSLGYSAYGAASISDAYGTAQPPLPGQQANNEADPAKAGERSQQLKALKERIHNSVGKTSSGGTRMGDFNPLPPAALAETSGDDQPVQSFDGLPSESIGGFPLDYTQATGTYAATPTGQTALMEKLNYAIHLLETQQDRRTATVTEELLLYALLGMFIICVLDNFARVGKYVR
jgi:hypothetical protein